MNTGEAPLERLARALRVDLDAAGYTLDHLAELFGEQASAALHREQVIPALRRVRTSADPAAVLARLFILGDEVTAPELTAALPTAAGQAAELGLIEPAGGQSGAGDPGGGHPGVSGTARGGIDLRPVDLGASRIYLAADLGEATTGRAVGAEHVLGMGGASRTLAELTVRTPVVRALDLGTGSGVQALNLAGFAEHVTATDISTDAIGYAALNAILNHTELDLRQGSMLEPVAGERFDLVVSNPPFVITPREAGALPAYTYRDGGRTGDELARDLVTGVGAHLKPGGIAQFLLNWEVHDLADPFASIRNWCEASGLDAWVIARESADPAEYAETWLRDGGITADRDSAAWDRGYRAWLADFERRSVQAVSFGYLTLHRPVARQQRWLRSEELAYRPPGPLGGTIAATLAAKDALAALDDRALAALALTVAPDVTEERHYRPGSADPEVIVLHQGGGLGRSTRADTALAAVVGASDGELTLAQIAAGVAVLTDARPDAVLESVIADIRGLVLDGFLHLPRYREE